MRPRNVSVPVYELTEEADTDLQEIVRYTISRWGIEQARKYEALLEGHFLAIGRNKIRTKDFFQNRPEVRVSRAEHHYVFHLVREGKCPLILAVFHENMNLMAQLRKRLAS